MIKVAIFDLDGTLLNTLVDLTDCTNFALKKFGYPSRTLDEIRNFVGNGIIKLFERAGVKDKECVEFFKKYYAKNMYNKTAPYDGIIPLLNSLHEHGIKIAVVSNKFDLAVKKLCEKYFDIVDIAIGENEAEGIHKKPSPDGVLKILDDFKFLKDEAIFIGDSEVDIQTAKNAGIPCISVTWGFKTRDFLIKNGAKILVDKPEEILMYFNKVNTMY